MEKGYGQKAPTLADGTTLLQELHLDAEQTQYVKSDIASLKKAKVDTLKTFFLILLLDNAFLFAGMILGIRLLMDGVENNLAMSMIPVFLIVVSMMLGRYRKKGDERLAHRMIDIITQSKAAPAVMNVFRRYMPGDTGTQRLTYINLLLKNDSMLSGDQAYRVRLDTSSDNYVVREVVLPKTA